MIKEENRLQLDMAAVEKRSKQPKTVGLVFGEASQIKGTVLVNARTFTTDITKNLQKTIKKPNVHYEY